MQLTFHDLTFQYPTQPEPVLRGLTVRFERGFTGIVGANGAGKTTVLQLAAGLLSPTAGSIQRQGAARYLAQRTDDPPADLALLLTVPDGRAARLAGQLELGSDWHERWETLSHGERKRAQIAAALWREPDVLCIDEPTNHVDASTRQFVTEALRLFRGIGLLVSHDRALLDELCSACLVFEPAGPRLRPGGYSPAQADADRELTAMAREKRNARRELAALQDAASARRREADRADAKRSRRKLAPGDSDGRGRISRARVTGKDGQAGRVARQLQGRVDQATQRASQCFVPTQRRLGVDLTGEPARRPVLLDRDAGEIPLAPGRVLHVPPLVVRRDDRIGVTGPNGAGKSTLLHDLLRRFTGSSDRLLLVPQEIRATDGRGLLSDVRRLTGRQLGDAMGAVAALGSDPERLLATEQPSPGELRKLLLALGLTRRPHLIVMDEPTNHLDLPSIQCLEQALIDCRCALLLVSHDAGLLQRTAQTTWTIDRDGPDSRLRLASPR